MPAETGRGRVLLVVENMSVPQDRRVWQEAQTLAAAGYEVVVASPRGDEVDRKAFERRQEIDIHRFASRPARSARGYAIEYGWALWELGRLARRLSRQERFTVVHVCNPPDMILPVLRLLLPRSTRLVFDHHDAVPELYLSRFGRGRDLLYRTLLSLERVTFRLADVVIATNESYRQIAITRGGKRPDDVFVVRNAPDERRFADVKPDARLKHDKPHLLVYAGVMGPQDGVDQALRSLAVLRKSRTDWTAVLAGDGDAAPAMRELARELGLDDLVSFPGWLDQEELGRLIVTADVCLAPDPPSPLNDISTMVKVAEYMAAGRPIVSFELPETRITAKDTILYARTEDDFAQRISDLLDDPERRTALGGAAAARVAEGLTWQHSERELLAAYDRTLQVPVRTRRRRSS